MKPIKITALVAATLFSQLAYADFQFATLSNTCESLAGKWVGTGHAKNAMVDCTYKGDAMITMTDGTHFMFDVSVDKTKGSFLCPKHEDQHLEGNCDNGRVSIHTDYGNLVGQVTSNQGNATGTLTILPGIKADVEIAFARG